MEDKNIEKLISDIKKYNIAYREGRPLISDNEYDDLIELLKKMDPNNSFFDKGIIEENSKDRMEQLPLPMFSLEKTKTIKDLISFMKNQWKITKIKNVDIVITPKYDGISLCVDEKNQRAWTRGDGIEGQRSDSHYTLMKKDGNVSPFVSFSYGEAIFNVCDFLENKGSYKSARNCVAGLFNSSEPSELLKHVTYVRYGSDRDDLDKDKQLALVNPELSYKLVSSFSFLEKNEKELESWLSEVFEKITIGYKCDGLVIELNDAKLRKKLGRLPNNNPRYAIAYKDPSWAERTNTTVKGIEWNVSKDGLVKPVILTEPVDLCGATIQRVTGHNAAYICDNHICTNAEITIARSGDVIPKHLKTLKYQEEDYQQEIDDAMLCPSCGKPLKWNENHIELVCVNQSCKERLIQKLVHYFSVLNFDEMREATIRKFYNAGYTTLRQILTIKKDELIKIEGFGTSSVDTLLSQFDNVINNGVSLSELMTALNCFDGSFGVKTCQTIIDQLNDIDLEKLCDLEEIEETHLTAIKGVAPITARIFNQGIVAFRKQESVVPVSYVKKRKTKIITGNQMTVVFSGFRDKDLEKRLVDLGYNVASSVSKNTNYVIVKDLTSSSSKVQKAQSLGVSIIGLDEFLQKL